MSCGIALKVNFSKLFFCQTKSSTEVKLGVLLVKDTNFLNSKWRHDDAIMLFCAILCKFDHLLQTLRTKQDAIFVFHTRLLLPETEHQEFVIKKL